MSSVGICVATLDRPAQLAQLLARAAELDLPNDEAGIPFHVVVAVADNDPGGSAKPIVDSLADDYAHELRYTRVDRRGVVHARNATVELAGEVDWLAFVDDDELPARDWLLQLLRTAVDNDAAVVAGPVPELFDQTAPSWYSGAGLDQPEHQPTGSTIKWFGVGNALVRRSVIECVDGPFDDRFNLTGGEDVYLGLQVQQQGHRMVWCDEAVATTLVAADRTGFGWVMRRKFNSNRNYSRALRLANAERPWGEVSRSAGRLVEAVARAGLAAIRLDRGALAAAVHLAAGAVGKFAGTFEATSKTTWWD